ncbi:MAG TPA: GAF domain-containing protein [Blastocatellia bacterium]|nr:GAF domain-containing protein [Blastocatellia bacterium]
MENEREVRLRRQIEDIVRSRLGLLEQDISHLQREVNESFTRLLERTDAAASMPDSDEMLTQIEAEVSAQIDQAGAQSVRLGADIALLRDSVVELDQQSTQAEVLNALVARAANFAPRVVLFVVKSGNALAWAARGFEEHLGNNNVRGLSVSLQSDTLLKAALNSQQTFYGSPEEQPDNETIFSRLGNIQPQRALAVPLKVRGKSAAVLYADSADRGEGATNVEAIELLVHTAGLVVELVSLRARMVEGAQPAARQSAPATSAPAPAAAAQAPQPVTPPPSAQPTPEEAPPPERITAEPVPEPAPQTFASQTESMPAATAEFQQPASPAPAGFVSAVEPQPEVEQPAAAPESYAAAPNRTSTMDEEEKMHNDARRFARLLVSEIKLYNEQKVAEGRRNNDLYDRLKEDIDRSRQMYEKRVTPAVAARFDYFYDELVNTLAEGDPAKLGSDHPGPSVSV